MQDTLIAGGLAYLPGCDPHAPPVRDILVRDGRIAAIDGPDENGAAKDDVRRCAAGAVAQDGRERVVNRVGLTEGNNGTTARHGVSAPSGVQAGLHPPRYAALLKLSSPRFGHSSAVIPPHRMLDHLGREAEAAARFGRHRHARHGVMARPSPPTRQRPVACFEHYAEYRNDALNTIAGSRTE